MHAKARASSFDAIVLEADLLQVFLSLDPCGLNITNFLMPYFT